MSDAAWTIAGTVVGMLGTGIFGLCLQQRQFTHNKDMFLLQNKGAEQVKGILVALLCHRDFSKRSFKTLKSRIGGYEDDEVRRLLHELGAVKSTASDGRELWELPKGKVPAQSE